MGRPELVIAPAHRTKKMVGVNGGDAWDFGAGDIAIGETCLAGVGWQLLGSFPV
jgi:hypothetical protein